jgi:5'-phosphate synthase pdxT subunit
VCELTAGLQIGVLAVQGAFLEHEKKLAELDVSSVELRERKDLDRSFDGLILPGGESTVQGQLLQELDMFEPLREQLQSGLPVLATCAGLILLAEQIENDDHRYFRTLPVTVARNAYGRQLGSFHTEQTMDGIGPVPMTFIRAPQITETGEGVQVLAQVNDQAVAVRSGNQLAMSFHPELDHDLRIHQLFLEMVSSR